MATRPTRPSRPAPPASSPEPAGRRPTALRLAAAAQLIEALGLAVAGVFAAASTVDGRSYQLVSGIALTLIAFGTAAGLTAIAVGLVTARPWSRIPAAMTQLFVIIGGVTLLNGNRPEWGVPALLLAGVCLAGLLTPASLRALNRPPEESLPEENPPAENPPAEKSPAENRPAGNQHGR
jgi:hypothetical protein